MGMPMPPSMMPGGPPGPPGPDAGGPQVDPLAMLRMMKGKKKGPHKKKKGRK